MSKFEAIKEHFKTHKELYIGLGVGNSGNIIKDVTTGTIYPSQNAAAKALGIRADSISKHLSGKNSDAAGHVFEKLIDGGAPHILQTV